MINKNKIFNINVNFMYGINYKSCMNFKKIIYNVLITMNLKRKEMETNSSTYLFNNIYKSRFTFAIFLKIQMSLRGFRS